MKAVVSVDTPLVSVDWLYENLQAENLVIFDATIPKVTEKSDKSIVKIQLPNAIFFDIKNVFSDVNSIYPNTLVSQEEFEFKAQNLGVNSSSTIVVYDDLGIYSSPRVWWMFKTFGFENIAVLDGGLPAWIEAGFEVEKPTNHKQQRGNFQAKFNSDRVSSTERVLKSISKEVCIVDARSNPRFLGSISEPRKEVKSGHIPNSINLPFTELQQGTKMKPSKELEELFEGINPNNNPFIFSCGSGITACVLALGAELSKIKNYSIYDGSWSEWGSRDDLPIEELKSSGWSKIEFEVYILLYCAQSNFIETKEERDYIISRVNESVFNRIHTEIVHDSDRESKRKIEEYLKENTYSVSQKDDLLRNIKNVFFADGTVDVAEKRVFLFLKNLLNSF